MSSEIELQEELRKTKELINHRKQTAMEKKIYEKLEFIIENLGEWNDWWGGRYYYIGPYFSGYLFQNTIKIHIFKSPGKEEVIFSGTKKETSIYQSGVWENYLDELRSKAIEKMKQKNLNSLQKEISQLKQKWGLE